ncbi:unnamed protein product [Linum trigynum]|uniref:Uncharacterized protein n=1 Tax=Linum trigynum TaxID=586398 RepID=A0AAV2CT66_9ROSI
MIDFDDVCLELIPDEMAVDFNVFGVLVECGFLSDVYGGLTVAIEGHRLRMGDFEVLKEVEKPLNLVRGVGKSTIFYFAGRSRNSGLLLALPGDERRDQIDTITSN